VYGVELMEGYLFVGILVAMILIIAFAEIEDDDSQNH